MKYATKAWNAIILAIVLILAGCDEDTGSLGVYPQQDDITTSSDFVNVLSSDFVNNVVPAGSTTCYLGKVLDPETNQAITATFAAQFHTFENYTFPAIENIVAYKETGSLCNSIELRLVIKDTFGDKNNPMKVEVWPLSMSEDKLLNEAAELYTNTDLWQYVDDSNGPIATKVFTATDYALSDAQRADGNYIDNIRIVLPREKGESIMQNFYSQPNNFRDSYSFIRNVCPGFLFRTVSGTGTMVNLEVCNMDLHFRYSFKYKDNNGNEKDSIVSALCRFAATPEVIQSTQFENSNVDQLIGNEEYTMLKTPAGICTELILPINDIYKGHEKDSISRASLTLTRINNRDTELDVSYAFGIPKNLLLVRKKDFENFFKNNQVSDSQKSYTTQFNETYNCYTFDNLSRLISYCQHEKQAGIEALGSIEDAEKVWEAANPDWNHVLLVPVTVASATDSYGTTTQVSVNQDLSLCSTKLVRGTETNPIKMQVIYSRFSGQQ